MKEENLMEVEDIIAALEPYNLKKVAEEVGLHRLTLYRLKGRQHKPDKNTIRALTKFLRGDDQE